MLPNGSTVLYCHMRIGTIILKYGILKLVDCTEAAHKSCQSQILVFKFKVVKNVCLFVDMKGNGLMMLYSIVLGCDGWWAGDPVFMLYLQSLKHRVEAFLF